ncbi:MAG: FtsX-like permease family protein [Chlorobi bacterium]|nr:FtsX-like permease family protein [Chlorobiota bacterium]
MHRYFHDIVIAFESIMSNKLKSVLTALGIIFGVAAVISMLAIGKGAKQEILDQIKMVGVNNIVITPIVEDSANSSDENNQEGEKQKNKFSPGLTLLDAESIMKILPSVERISPEISLNSFVVQNGKRSSAKVVGVLKDYFGIYNLDLVEGTYFNHYQEEHGLPVCIIGANIKSRFFNQVDAIGQYVKFGNTWFRIIGVLRRTNLTLTSFENTGVNVYNDNIYIPVKTFLMRIENRALVNTKAFQNSIVIRGFGFVSIRSSSATQNTNSNYHQLDKIVVQVKESEQLTPSTEVLSRMMIRRHLGVKDFEITIPELLLKQQQRTKDIFNIVLGAIASISLIVGGIGIMNIMFATVMERIKEIGTRMAIGAKKKDIVIQFLSEAILISVSGGFIGVFLGVFLAKIIQQLAGIQTIISLFAVVIAFGVSAAVGVVFGYTPAKRASEKDPIESLRYE